MFKPANLFLRSSAVVAVSAFGVSTAAFAQSPVAPTTSVPAGYHLEATWKPGGDGGWDYLVFDPEARRLYVTRTDRVQVIDGDQGTLLGEVPGAGCGHAR